MATSNRLGALVLLFFLPSLSWAVDSITRLYHTDFSRLPPGIFGEFAVRGFPEYHHIPRKFTDGWDVVNNRGPEEWKVIEIEGKNTLNFLGYNREQWTKDFIYPMLCTGDPLWTDYTVEVATTPLSRPEWLDLQGVIFRYQDGRHYYFFGLTPDNRLSLRCRDGEKGFRQDGWHELGTSSKGLMPGRRSLLRVEVNGPRITCSLDGDKLISATDTRFLQGKVGLLACSPVRFHEVRVETSASSREEWASRKKKEELELEGLRRSNPPPLLWRKIQTPGFGVSRAMRLGELNGDGKLDFLLAQSIPYFGSNYHQISCLTALDSEGQVLWQKGKPNPDHAYVSYDVAVQIHDWDGDGSAEVIYAEDRKILVLNGKTGELKQQFSVPESRILPEETSWKEYQHYYRRDHLPFLNVDSISFADLRGTGRPADIILKDRHTRLWAYNERFELLWTASANLGHFPWFSDFDQDGRDEVFLGYTLFDHDGRVIWSLDGKLEEHADGICGGNFCLDSSPAKVFISASDDGVAVASAEGQLLLHHRVGHAQTPSFGQFRTDAPGLEFCNINYWGEPGLITLYSGCTGEELTHFELIHAGSPILPVNWRGDGQEFILLSTSVTEGGMLDGYGRRVVMFPLDGHPEMASMVQDLTGDSRDEIITWNPDSIWVYTQAEPFRGEKIYAPRRTPLWNESNYSPTVSWPGWDKNPAKP
jgi:hypothetical protein